MDKRESNNNGFDLEGVSLDQGKTVSEAEIMEVEGVQCAFQTWSRKGIHAKRLIFKESDVKGLSDDDLERMVRKSGCREFKRKGTVSRNIVNKNRKKFAIIDFDFTLKRVYILR